MNNARRPYISCIWLVGAARAESCIINNYRSNNLMGWQLASTHWWFHNAVQCHVQIACLVGHWDSFLNESLCYWLLALWMLISEEELSIGGEGYYWQWTGKAVHMCPPYIGTSPPPTPLNATIVFYIVGCKVGPHVPIPILHGPGCGGRIQFRLPKWTWFSYLRAIRSVKGRTYSGDAGSNQLTTTLYTVGGREHGLHLLHV